MLDGEVQNQFDLIIAAHRIADFIQQTIDDKLDITLMNANFSATRIINSDLSLDHPVEPLSCHPPSAASMGRALLSDA